MAHLFKPKIVPQRPVMMSEHAALAEVIQLIGRDLQQTICRLNALAIYLGARQTVTEHKDEHGNVTAVTFVFVPAIVGASPDGDNEQRASEWTPEAN